MSTRIRHLCEEEVLYLCVYVDDLLLTGSDMKMLESFKTSLVQHFEMTDLEMLHFYLGIQVVQQEQGTFLTQSHYARKLLKEFGMLNCKGVSTPIALGTKLTRHSGEQRVDPEIYRSLIGSLRYLSCTRPDILFSVGLLSRYMENPTTAHFTVCKKVLRYIKNTVDYGMWYTASSALRFQAYSDSDWGGDVDDRKSTTGYVGCIGDTAFTWTSRKQPIVALSSTESEYIAAASCVSHAMWLQQLLIEMGLKPDQPIELLVDNVSAIAVAKNPVYHNRSKHIDVRFHFLREAIAKGTVTLKYVRTQYQLANILTKPLGYFTFTRLREMLGCHH